MNIPIRWSDNTADLKKNLAQGLDQIEATRAAADKMVRSLGGDTLIAAAHKYAAAVAQLGGAAKLTVANQERVNAVMTKAVGVMNAAGKGGSDVAKHFAALAAATAQTKAPLDTLVLGMGKAGAAATDSARLIQGMSASGKAALLQVAAAAKAVGDAAAAAKAPLDAMAAGMNRAGAAATSSAKMISGMSSSGKQALEQQAAAARSVADAAERAAKPLDAMAAGMGRAGKEASASGKMIAGMGAAGKGTFVDLEKQAKLAANAWGAMGEKWSAFGTGAKALGGVLVAGLTVPIVGLGVVAAKAAIDFDTSFAGVRKTVDGVVGAGGKLSAFGQQLAQDFRNLAQTIPISVGEINRIGEAAGQLGIRAEDILLFTKTMAILGTTTNLTADAAATGIAQIQNSYQAAGKETDRFAAALVALGIDSAASESQILEFATRVAGAGKIAGMSQADILGISTAMASVGVEAEAGGTALQKVFLSMTSSVESGGAKLEAFARIAGVSAEEFKNLFNASPSEAFNKWVEGLGTAGRGAIGVLKELGLEDQRLIRSFLSLAGAGGLLRRELALGNTAWDENSAHLKAAAEKWQAFSAQWQIFKNQINDIGITLGDVLLRIGRDVLTSLKPLVEELKALADGFANLPVPVQNTTVGIAGIVAGIPLAIFGLGSLAGAAGNLMTALQTLGWVQKATAVAFIGAAAWWIAIPAAIAACVVAIKEMTGSWTIAFDIMLPPIGGMMTAWQNLQEVMKQNPKEAAAIKSSFASLASIIRDETALAVDKLSTAYAQLRGEVGKIPAAIGWFKQAILDANPAIAALIAKLKEKYTLSIGISYEGAAKGLANQAARSKQRRAEGARGVDLPEPPGAPTANVPATFAPVIIEGTKALADFRAEGEKVVKTVSALETKIAALTEAQKDDIAAGVALKHSYSQIAKDVQSTTDVVSTYIRQQKGNTTETGLAARSLKVYGNAWNELNDLSRVSADMTGAVSEETRGLILYYHELGATVSQIVKARIAEKGVVEGVINTYDRNEKELNDTIERMQAFREVGVEAATSVGAAQAGMLPALKELAQHNGTLMLSSRSVGVEMGKLPGIADDVAKDIAQANTVIGKSYLGLTAEQKKQIDSLRAVGRTSAEIAKTMGLDISQVGKAAETLTTKIRSIGGVVHALGETFAMSFGQNDPFTILVQGAGRAVDALSDVSAAAQKVKTDGLTASSGAGMVMSTLGMFNALVSIAEAYYAAEKAANALYITQQHLVSIQRDYSTGIHGQVRGFAVFTDALEKTIEDLETFLEHVYPGRHGFQSEFMKLRAEALAFKDVFDELGGGIDNGSFLSGNQLVQFKDQVALLQEMIARGGQVGARAFEALQAMMGEFVPTLDDITAAAGRYGLTLDQLGPKVNQLSITEAATAIVSDFDLLIEAGVPFETLMADIITRTTDTGENFDEMSEKAKEAYLEAGGVITTTVTGMHQQIQDLVSEALRSGLALPESMRPVIEQLIAAGDLVDDNGQALTDISKIDFAKPLEMMVNDLVAALDRLIAKWEALNGTVSDTPPAPDPDAPGRRAPVPTPTPPAPTPTPPAPTPTPTPTPAPGGGARPRGGTGSGTGINPGENDWVYDHMDPVVIPAPDTTEAELEWQAFLERMRAAGVVYFDTLGQIMTVSSEDVAGLVIPIEGTTEEIEIQQQAFVEWRRVNEEALAAMADGAKYSLEQLEVLRKTGVDALIAHLMQIPDVDFNVTQHVIQTVGEGGEATAFARGVTAFRTIGTDTIPAMLTPRELVINEAQTGRLGQALAHGVNLMRLDTTTTGTAAAPTASGPFEIVIEVDGQRLGKTVFDPRNLSGATRQRFRAAVHEVGSEVPR